MAGVITAIKAYKTLREVGEGLAGCLTAAVKPDITPGEMAELIGAEYWKIIDFLKGPDKKADSARRYAEKNVAYYEATKRGNKKNLLDFKRALEAVDRAFEEIEEREGRLSEADLNLWKRVQKL